MQYFLLSKFMKYITCILLLALLGSCTADSSTDEDSNHAVPPNTFYTENFYFPLEELTEGKVYEYVVVHHDEVYLSHYWWLKSEQAADGTQHLIWERYNPAFEQDQYIKEWVVKDGVITQEYTFLIKDSASQTIKKYPNHVSQNVVFPFYASLDSVMAYRFVCEMKLPPDFLTVKLIRDRKFVQETTYTYQDQEVDAIVFSSMDLYDMENRAEGGFWKQKRAVIEVYAKGLGLVYTEEKIAGEEATEITRLSNVYTVEEFRALQEKD